MSGDCLKIWQLSKEFDSGKQKLLAVNNLNLTMYKGQIFALLGHNGAGKTTAISILTGLFQKSSGSASAFGIDIFRDMNEFWKILGICPQHNILFDTLTPAEHFEIFLEFKGESSNQQEQITQTLHDVDLFSQKDVLSKNLSGG